MAKAGVRSAVVYDPHHVWLDAITRVLEGANIHVVAAAESAPRALALVAEETPDILVVDVDAAGDLGTTVVRRARDLASDIKVIALSPRHDADLVTSALVAGACAFIVKTAGAEDVAFAVRQAFEPSIYLAESPVASASPSGADGGEAARLTRREREILRLVGAGRSNADVARELWVTEQTVKFHLSNVYRKIGASNRTQAVRWGAARGLLK